MKPSIATDPNQSVQSILADSPPGPGTETTDEQPVNLITIRRSGEINRKSPLKIAMIGQKGIPAIYGGVERHVENLSAELVRLGHEVTVYCRPYYCRNMSDFSNLEHPTGCRYRGVKLVMLPSIRTKHLDAISHSILASLAAGLSDFDIVHFHGIGPSLVNILPKLTGKKVVSTIHALDYRQKKWGKVARLFLKLGFRLASKRSDRAICVSNTFLENIKSKERAIYIPNGVDEPSAWGIREKSWLRENGLDPGRYLLFVGRLIEDKRCHLLCRAIEQIEGYKLAIAGQACFTDDYAVRLKNTAGPKSVFLGNVTGSKLSALYSNSALFVLPSIVEGASIAVLEAMSHGVPVLVSDIPENIQLVRPSENRKLGLLFRSSDDSHLLQMINYAISRREKLIGMARNAKIHVSENYSWPEIARKTQDVYYEVLNRPRND
mgnify:CR=1 FL=1